MTSVARVRDTASSDSWPGPAPGVSVIVSTHNRGELLGGLLDAFDALTTTDAEFVIADNGSSDDTWSRLVTRCASTALRLRAIRLDPHDGPGVPRNTAVAQARGELLAFTDDDCRPEPNWLGAIAAGFDDAATVLVQGRTQSEEGGWAGPWGRSVTVTALSGLYETANLAVRRSAFEEVGGFEPLRRLTGRAFGEDVLLGAAVARTGQIRFASDAVVRHLVMPGGYRDLLTERLRLAGFPTLMRDVPELRSRLTSGVFLSQRTAITDLGVAGAIGAVGSRRGWPLLATVPWLHRVWRESADRPGRPRAIRAGQLLLADLVGLGALSIGSVRSRRPTL